MSRYVAFSYVAILQKMWYSFCIIGSGMTDYILHNVNGNSPSKIGVF